jgi:hypothetical protein
MMVAERLRALGQGLAAHHGTQLVARPPDV